MQAFAILVALTGLLVCASALSWDEYKLRYNKQYQSPAEEVVRHAIYQSNLARIAGQNSLEPASFKLGINHLTDMKRSEYLRLNGLRLPKRVRGQANLPLELLEDDKPVPESVDWRQEEGRVSPVKNQGNCGSCWSFATTGLLEGQQYRRPNGSLVALSEEELIDCDTVDLGCDGGAMENALEFIRQEGGLESERDYPYVSGDGPVGDQCAFDRSKVVAGTERLKGFKDLPQGDEEALRRVVARYGPVAVGIDASQPSFQAYESGVYYERRCGNKPEQLDHAVLVVGYGTCPEQGDYWIVKNSWSEHWGERGYFRLARNRANHCGVATAPSIALF